MGRDRFHPTRRCETWGFNPRARVGRDIDPPAGSGVRKKVSIHAPAWGATWPHVPDGRRQRVSIHAPAWGATSAGRRQHRSQQVSIHAPAWGATRRPYTRAPFILESFNPRARVGRDAESLGGVEQEIMVSIHAPAWGATFVAVGAAGLSTVVSIHAPAWGATPQHTETYR